MEHEGDQSEWNPYDTVRLCRGSPARKQIEEQRSKLFAGMSREATFPSAHQAAGALKARLRDQNATMRPPPIKKLRRPPVEFVMADVAGGQTHTVLGRDTAMARNSANHALETPATATVGQPSRFSLRDHSDGSADGLPKQEHNS